MDLSDAVFVLRVCCGTLLLWAGFHKLAHLNATREAILGYRLVPFRFVRVAAVVLPTAEFLTGALLVVDVQRTLASATALVVFAIFAGGIASTLARGIKTECSCFSTSPVERTSSATLARAIVLVAMSATLVAASLREPAVVASSRLLPDLTIAVGVAVVLRLAGFIPATLSYLREKPVIAPARGHRVSMRHLSLDPPERLLLDEVEHVPERL